jgi:protocatechuate 3,4-dioxygenase beta subunit
MSSREDAGHAVTRRQALGLAGTAGAVIVLGRVSGPRGLLDAIGVTPEARAATTSCVLTPAKTEGPYFVDEKLDRSDIRADPGDGTVQDGVPLRLTVLIVRADGDCAPVSGATVDVWHANAQGLYSDEAANRTVGRKYLRGYQVSDDNGQVAFTTIYPGWYPGRAIHIHYKVRLYDARSKTYEFTSQLFFDPRVTSQVVRTAAYSAHGSPDTANANDSVYGANGGQLIVSLVPDGNGGYGGTFVVGLSGLPGTTATPATRVDAAVTSRRFRRTPSGGRVLRLVLELGETVTASARITRAGRTLAHRRVAGLQKGTRTLELVVPARTAGGSARLDLTFTDAGGAVKSTHRAITVPRR